MANTEDARRSLVQRILEGDGRSPHGQRRLAFDNAVTVEPLRTLLDKVVNRADRITNGDVDAVLAWGQSEDQLFELVICAAVGEAARQHAAAIAALDAATRSA